MGRASNKACLSSRRDICQNSDERRWAWLSWKVRHTGRFESAAGRPYEYEVRCSPRTGKSTATAAIAQTWRLEQREAVAARKIIVVCLCSARVDREAAQQRHWILVDIGGTWQREASTESRVLCGGHRDHSWTDPRND